MGKSLYLAFDLVVFAVCVPFYVVAVPLICLLEWIAQQRPVRLGLEISHCPGRDWREDYLVVDVSRVKEGLVGVRQRSFCTMNRGGHGAPPYSETIDFIRIERFWVPSPMWSSFRT